VQVNPTTVNAGGTTQVTANCGDNANSATISSTVFGSQTLQSTNGVLTATVTVPPTAPAGQISIRLACPSGNQASTTITIIGASKGASVPGPNTGGGFLAGNEDTPGAEDTPGNEDMTEVASEPADRTPLVWLGVGLSSLLAAGAVAFRAKKRAPVRSEPHTERHDQGTAGPR